MVYGAEIDKDGCRYMFELKTKNGVLKRLEKQKVVELVYHTTGYTATPINDSKFVIYCRTEWKNIYDKSSYSKLIGNYKGSWEY